MGRDHGRARAWWCWYTKALHNIHRLTPSKRTCNAVIWLCFCCFAERKNVSITVEYIFTGSVIYKSHKTSQLVRTWNLLLGTILVDYSYSIVRAGNCHTDWGCPVARLYLTFPSTDTPPTINQLILTNLKEGYYKKKILNRQQIFRCYEKL